MTDFALSVKHHPNPPLITGYCSLSTDYLQKNSQFKVNMYFKIEYFPIHLGQFSIREHDNELKGSQLSRGCLIYFYLIIFFFRSSSYQKNDNIVSVRAADSGQIIGLVVPKKCRFLFPTKIVLTCLITQSSFLNLVQRSFANFSL